MTEALKRFDVFLSHNRQQKAWVRNLHRVLVQHGLRVFFDEDSIEPGERIGAAIDSAIAASRFVVLVLSPSALKSRWVMAEAYLSLHVDGGAAGPKVVPVVLEEFDFGAVGLSLRSVSWIDLRSPATREAQIRRLLAYVGVRNADGIPTRHLSDLLRTSSEAEPDELQIAGIDDVLTWGWNGTELLRHLIELDYLTTEDLTLAHEGSPEQWGPVFMGHPDTWRLLILGPRNIVGYWHMAPLFPSEYALAKSGDLLDSQITADTLEPFAVPGHFDTYLVQVCMHPRHRHPRNVQLLFESMFGLLDELSEDGVFFREVTANGFTKVGRGLCRTLGLTLIADRAEHTKIYSAPIDTVLRSRLAERYPAMRARYVAQGLLRTHLL